MKDLLEKILAWLKRVVIWFSPPVRLCTSAIALAFLISFIGWVAFDPFFDAVLYFPKGQGTSLRGEIRSLPKTGRSEARAELIAGEVLLGPITPGLRPAFPTGVRVESTICRRGVVFIDLSEDAALSEPAALKLGLAAMQKSLRAGLPLVHRVRITIGGVEPYAYAVFSAPSTAIKGKKK
jgi:hypothetical protein